MEKGRETKRIEQMNKEEFAAFRLRQEILERAQKAKEEKEQLKLW